MKILEKQGYHLLSILVLSGGIWLAAQGDILEGVFLGLSSRTWLILSVLFPVLHQIYVVICWRGELYYGWLSKTLGERAFKIWAVGFMILFLARPITIFALAIANRGTLALLLLNISALNEHWGSTIFSLKNIAIFPLSGRGSSVGPPTLCISTLF